MPPILLSTLLWIVSEPIPRSPGHQAWEHVIPAMGGPVGHELLLPWRLALFLWCHWWSAWQGKVHSILSELGTPLQLWWTRVPVMRLALGSPVACRKNTLLGWGQPALIFLRHQFTFQPRSSIHLSAPKYSPLQADMILTITGIVVTCSGLLLHNVVYYCMPPSDLHCICVQQWKGLAATVLHVSNNIWPISQITWTGLGVSAQMQSISGW